MDSLFFQLNKSSDDVTFKIATNQGPISYINDGLITSHNCDFLKDDRFKKAYELGKATGSWTSVDIYWRAYVACWAGNYAKDLEGDFVECGVFKGGLSRAIIEYTEFNKRDKTFYLVDTFEGLDDKQVTNEERIHGIKSDNYPYYKNAFESVKNTFEKFHNVQLIKGRVPEVLPQVRADKVAYLSIDMNCKAPEVAAIEYFWDKLVDGAVVLFDDYGFYNHIEQKKALDLFAGSKNIEILTIPTGQGLMIKPPKVSKEISNTNIQHVEIIQNINKMVNYLDKSTEGEKVDIILVKEIKNMMVFLTESMNKNDLWEKNIIKMAEELKSKLTDILEHEEDVKNYVENIKSFIKDYCYWYFKSISL